MKRFMSSSPIWPETGLALVRVGVGVFMIYHGWEVFSPATMNEYLQWDTFKDLTAGKQLVYLGKSAELVGGVMLALGWWTRAAALILFCTMSYVSFFVGNGKVWYEDQHPFMFVLLAVVFLFMGGGRWSADYIIFKR